MVGLPVLLGSIVVMLILFKTPEHISHLTWAVTIRRAYKVEGEKGYRRISYNHEHTDGSRIAHFLKSGKLPPKIRDPTDQCDVWTRVRIRPNSLKGSPFTQLVATLVAHSKFMKMDGFVTSGVLVGTRYKLPQDKRWVKGCYVRTAHVHSYPGDAVQTIMDKHTTAITNIKDDPRTCDTCIERTNTLRCHYIFNKWMLDRIVRDDGRVLQLHRGGHRVSLEYILNINMPIDIKMIEEEKGVWVLLVTPLWLTIRQCN